MQYNYSFSPRKIYIAGKVTGDPNYVEKFAKAKEFLKTDRNVVLTPTFLPSSLSADDCMQVCMTLINIVDEVVFLPDYLDSEGALIEMSYCKYIGKEFTVMPADWL